MKNLKLKTLFIPIVFVFFVSLACGLSKSLPTKIELPTPQDEIIQENITEAPIITPADIIDEPIGGDDFEKEDNKDFIEGFDVVPKDIFVEEFDDDLSRWTVFLMNGDESKMNLYTNNGRLVFDLPARNLWVYLLFDEFTYSNVRIDTFAENLGKNTNNVSLICNYSDRFGWYEFNINNDGKYSISVYSEIDDGYFILKNGGSKNIKMGRNTNTYTATCQGNQLAFYVNGILEIEYTDRKYNLQEGQVGFGVSSFDELPVLVEIDYFAISKP